MLIQVIGFPENAKVIDLKNVLSKQANMMHLHLIDPKEILIHFSKDLCEDVKGDLICVRITCEFESKNHEETLKKIAKKIGEIIFQYSKKNLSNFDALEVYAEHYSENKVARYFINKQ